MATFGDVAIWKEGNVLLEEYRKFSVLREELFKICREVVLSSRSENQ
jgi:hypothetical protein